MTEWWRSGGLCRCYCIMTPTKENHRASDLCIMSQEEEDKQVKF